MIKQIDTDKVKSTKMKPLKMKKNMQDTIVSVIIHAIAVIMIIGVLYPLWFIIIASFSNPADVASGNVWFWPKEWVLDGYIELFKQDAIWKSYGNTIYIQ
jgi:putative aldouronate transport system permease protein